MNTNSYSRLLHLIEAAKGTSDRLHSEMSALNKHQEEPYASPEAVGIDAKKISEGLENAIKELRSIGAEKLRICGDIKP